jgi:phage shock protein A
MIRIWHYSSAFLTRIFEERADPRIQIEQALDEGRQMHLRLVDQAAVVIGGRRDLELKIARGTTEARRLDAMTARALRLSASARDKGDETGASNYERSAQLLATQLTATEALVADLAEQHERAAIQADAAHRAVEQNKIQLQRQLRERTRMLTALAAAEMQERMASALKAMDRLTPIGVTPTLLQIQDRIDQRISTSGAKVEIALDSVEWQTAQIERAMVDARGADRLEEIRRREGLSAWNGELT